jgi:hypothetical protein
VGAVDAPSPELDVYDVFGEPLALFTRSAPCRDMVRHRWAPFLSPAAGPLATGTVFHLSAPEASSRIKEWQFFNNGGLLVIADDRRLVTGYFYREPWQVHVTAYRQDPDYTYYYLLEPLWLMVLMRRGLVSWHSAAVARGKEAVLIVGPSGSGKSTTALTLAHAGYAVLADDEVFLRRVGDRVEALGAEPGLYATDETLGMFPALADVRATAPVRRGQAWKRLVAVRDILPSATPVVPPAAVTLILFPRVAPEAPTTLHPLAPREILERCLAQQPKEYPTLVTDSHAQSQQLDVYVTLSRSARAFDLCLGGDLARLPAEVDALLV